MIVSILFSQVQLQAEAAGDIPVGQLVERVVCLSDPTQSYALYLPSNYTTERRWPVLYCFDAGGRGRIPVERFQAGAEKFGYILVGSNNSKNGPWEVSAKAIDCLFKEIPARWAIEPKRVYATGMSGGARVASQMGVARIVRGVIACGGGFAGGETPQQVPCLYLGIAGVDDFNYPEMQNVERALKKNKFPHRFLTFAGKHEWPPSSTATEAIEWMEIQSMRTGLRDLDVDLVRESFGRRSGALAALSAPERMIELRSMAADFKDFSDVSALEKAADDLEKLSEVRDWIKAERWAVQRQRQAEDELHAQPAQVTIKSWRKKADQQNDTAERRLARRVLDGAFAAASERATTLLSQHEYADAISEFETASAIDPSRAFIYFQLARARCLNGDKHGGLAALKDAATRGFKDFARVEKEPAFEALRKEKQFAEACQKMRSNGAAN